MESKTNYTAVGLIVLILAAGLLSAGLWLSVGFDRKTYDTYVVYVRDTVAGLSDESQVKYNGVKVGYVDKIEINQFDPQQVKLILKIEAGTPITVSTHATLVYQGITGNTYLGLSASSPTIFPLQKTPGEPYPVIPYQPSFFSQIEKSFNDVSFGMKKIFDKQNADAIRRILLNAQKVTDVILANKNNLDKSLQDLPVILKGVKVSVRKFNRMATNMSTAGEQVSVTMKAGKNGIDKLSQQTLPPLVILLQRLDLIAANLEQVSTQLRQNPAVILRGAQSQQPGPGE